MDDATPLYACQECDDWIAAIRASELPPRARLISNLLADTWAPDGTMSHSVPNLMAESGLSRASVNRSFSDLVGGEWLIRVHGASRYASPVYRAQVPPEFVPRARSAVRRLPKKPIGNALRTAVYERDGYACVVCGIRKELTLDHIIPEALGGPTTFENLQTMCRTCNCRKGTRAA